MDENQLMAFSMALKITIIFILLSYIIAKMLPQAENTFQLNDSTIAIYLWVEIVTFFFKTWLYLESKLIIGQIEQSDAQIEKAIAKIYKTIAKIEFHAEVNQMKYEIVEMKLRMYVNLQREENAMVEKLPTKEDFVKMSLKLDKLIEKFFK